MEQKLFMLSGRGSQFIWVAGLGLALADYLPAQTFANLHSFHSFTGGTEGASPYAGLVMSGNVLYGATLDTIFAVNLNGSGFSTLHRFISGTDGGNVYSSLVMSSNTLYGTAETGGPAGYGTVFKLDLDTTNFAVLHSFDFGPNGHGPNSGLVVSGHTLYGTTAYGGGVFAVGTDGSGFTNLHTFTGLIDGTNAGGVFPYAGLILSGDTLFGTTFQGGFQGFGTVFRLNTNGGCFTNLHSFTGGCVGCGDAGAFPYARLALSGNTLYGTTHGDVGASGYGTVFKLRSDGNDFSTLHAFTGGSDGASPYAGLFVTNDTLFGVAAYGGTWGYGTVFKLKTEGTGFTNLYSFTPTVLAWQPPPVFLNVYTNTDGSDPRGGLVFAGNVLYGTTYEGGDWGQGAVFSLTLPPPQLTITRCQGTVILRWPTNLAGLALRSATNLESPTWMTVAPAPVVVDHDYIVTNSFSNIRQFYRLSP